MLAVLTAPCGFQLFTRFNLSHEVSAVLMPNSLQHCQENKNLIRLWRVILRIHPAEVDCEKWSQELKIEAEQRGWRRKKVQTSTDENVSIELDPSLSVGWRWFSDAFNAVFFFYCTLKVLLSCSSSSPWLTQSAALQLKEKSNLNVNRNCIKMCISWSWQ